ncbi:MULTISPECIES: hypothetical protein [Terrisporobacter]|uniref:Uncharacterized protein n=1 Tax=Terrisporobacter othiniensis TaxID=1577792 RepID=A0A0B3VU70_9FIRM|nr:MULTISPECIES: hypothetical protein [Terrisporobacter]KHS56368.1 hypothetical protein QX51_14045 [Terrisporobacter othiniensis]MCC3671058.1 hypothetical protein [Terrisporobacter mayombei]MDU6984654.1 hypothetical protein [Terrisporobacter othiniensis]
MKLGDVFVFGVDLVLFTYFTQIALNTTSMTIRIAACFAMTAEIFFMRQHLKMMKIISNRRED